MIGLRSKDEITNGASPGESTVTGAGMAISANKDTRALTAEEEPPIAISWQRSKNQRVERLIATGYR